MEKYNSPLQVDFIPMEYISPKNSTHHSKTTAAEQRQLFLNAIASGHPVIVRTTEYHNGIKISLQADGYKYPNPNVEVLKSPYKTKSITVGRKRLTLFLPLDQTQGYLQFVNHLHLLLDALFRGTTPKLKAILISTKIIVKLQNQFS